MPSYLMVTGASAGFAQALNKTYYYYPSARLVSDAGTEDFFQFIARDSYTLSNLYVYVSANTITNGTTVSSRKQTPPGAAANGNQSVSIPASTTGAFTDATNNDSLLDGDLFCTKVVTPNAGVSITFTIISYILSTAINTTPILATAYSASQGRDLTRYYPIKGTLYSTSALESSTYYIFRVAAILSNLRTYSNSNDNTVTSTLITRINGNNGGQSVSIPASTTGTFEDTVGTDSISVGQNVNYQLTTGATGGSLYLRSIQVKSNSEGEQVAVANPYTTTLAANLTRYVTIEGNSQSYNATETLVQATTRCAFTAKNMYVNISANTITDASTLTLRKDTGDSTLTVSVPASTTGQFEDLTHTVNFVAASLINWGIVTGATGTAITIVCIGFELAQLPPPTPVADGDLIGIAIIRKS